MAAETVINVVCLTFGPFAMIRLWGLEPRFQELVAQARTERVARPRRAPFKETPR